MSLSTTIFRSQWKFYEFMFSCSERRMNEKKSLKDDNAVVEWNPSFFFCQTRQDERDENENELLKNIRRFVLMRREEVDAEENEQKNGNKCGNKISISWSCFYRSNRDSTSTSTAFFSVFAAFRSFFGSRSHRQYIGSMGVWCRIIGNNGKTTTVNGEMLRWIFISFSESSDIRWRIKEKSFS